MLFHLSQVAPNPRKKRKYKRHLKPWQRVHFPAKLRIHNESETVPLGTLNVPFLPFSHCPMLLASGPSIFTKSPYEFAKERKRLRTSLPLIRQPVMYPAPRGYVLVRFLSRMEQMYMQPYFDFEAQFPLSDDGGLDLSLVKETWGLETCAPIHPERYKLFNPGNNHYLSPLAIYTLSVRPSGCVCIMEPHVSTSTEVQRTCRRFIVDFVEGVRGLYQDTKRNTCHCVQYKTRLPRYYRATQEKRKQLVSDYNHWHENWERKNGQGSVLMMLLLLFLFLFFLFIQSGYVEFRLRARMWAYLWTGSFKLPENEP